MRLTLIIMVKMLNFQGQNYFDNFFKRIGLFVFFLDTTINTRLWLSCRCCRRTIREHIRLYIFNFIVYINNKNINIKKVTSAMLFYREVCSWMWWKLPREIRRKLIGIFKYVWRNQDNSNCFFFFFLWTKVIIVVGLISWDAFFFFGFRF